MARTLLAVLAIVALAAVSAHAGVVAGITVNGDIGDWEALGLLHDDPTGDGAGMVDIGRYGATVIDDAFYAVMEINWAISKFDTGVIFPGAWINADQLGGDDHQLSGLADELAGTDINLEWGRGAGEGTGADPDYNFWGRDDDAGNFVYGGVPGGAHADSGAAMPGVMEWSAPVASIVDALAGLPDNVNSNFPWTVMLAVEGSIDGNSGWGRDYAGPLTVVPEPSALALLAGGLLGLLCYAWRKRK